LKPVQLPQAGVWLGCRAGDVQSVQGNCKQELSILWAVLTAPVCLQSKSGVQKRQSAAVDGHAQTHTGCICSMLAALRRQPCVSGLMCSYAYLMDVGIAPLLEQLLEGLERQHLLLMCLHAPGQGW
jgi:hypothetical protein